MIQIYRKTTYDMGVIRQIEKCHPANYGAPGEKREKKKKRTPDEIQRQNERNRWKKVQRIILANFKEGDWHLILKYGKGKQPDSYEEAVKHRRDFINNMRKAYRKAGVPFKWIAVTERGKKGHVLHHHMIIEDVDQDGIKTVELVKQFWKHGNHFFSSLYEDGDYEKLAEYIVKSETKEECGWCTYSRSRNLIVPQPKVEIIRHRKWRNPPVAPKGWYVVKDSIWNGMNPVTGYPVQHYTIKRLINAKAEEKGGGG